MPHTFTDVKLWSIAPTVRNNDARVAFNQLLEADAVYIRDVIHPDSMSDGQLKKLAAIAHIVYRSPDLAMRCLIELDKRKACEPDAVAKYRQTIR